MRELLGKTAGSAIMSDELWAVEALDLPDTVASLDDLSYFTGLRSLSLHHGASLDLSVLSRLPLLRSLDLSGCTLSTAAMNTIVTLPELTSLNLSGCAVAEIDALISLQKLETLDLSNNTVSDLTALSGLLALRELNLTNNPVTSLNNLKNCTELENALRRAVRDHAYWPALPIMRSSKRSFCPATRSRTFPRWLAARRSKRSISAATAFPISPSCPASSSWSTSM